MTVSVLFRRAARAMLLAAAVSAPAGVAALEVNIAEFIPYVDVEYEGKTIRVTRIQDTEHHLTGGYAKTSRPCPPFCFQPMQVAPGVATVGEVEVVKFLADDLRRGSGVLVDARTPDWFRNGTIPGAVNVPFTVLTLQDPEALELEEAMERFGARPKQGGASRAGFFSRLFDDGAADTSRWDFANAKKLLLFCNGPWCGQSPRAIRGLIEHGYPPEKLFYYRGGMQNWQIGGFTTVVPGAGG